MYIALHCTHRMIDLNKQVPSLDPVKLLDNQVWTAARELCWCVDDLIQSHGRSDIQDTAWPSSWLDTTGTPIAHVPNFHSISNRSRRTLFQAHDSPATAWVIVCSQETALTFQNIPSMSAPAASGTRHRRTLVRGLRVRSLGPHV